MMRRNYQREHGKQYSATPEPYKSRRRSHLQQVQAEEERLERMAARRHRADAHPEQSSALGEAPTAHRRASTRDFRHHAAPTRHSSASRRADDNAGAMPGRTATEQSFATQNSRGHKAQAPKAKHSHSGAMSIPRGKRRNLNSSRNADQAGSRALGASSTTHQADTNGFGVGASPAEKAANTSTRQSKRKKKAWTKKRIVITALSCILTLGLIGGGIALGYVQKISDNLRRGLSSEVDAALVKTDIINQPFYMLLLGTDRSKERDGDPNQGGSYRSDSMMLARIDAKNKKVTLISLNRDTLMDMGRHGRNKLNAAYALGGASYAIKTISQLAEVPISHYAEINFDGFKDVVDALGGVEVDVPMDIKDKLAGGNLKKGLQTLNGNQALILCRARHAYDDFGDGDMYRAANQRVVMAAIAKKILSADPATIAKTIDVLSNYITTDLSMADIVSLAQAMRGLDPSNDIYSAMEPVISKYIKGDGWYSFLEQERWRTMIDRVNQGLPPTETNVVDETGTILTNAGQEARTVKSSDESGDVTDVVQEQKKKKSEE